MCIIMSFCNYLSETLDYLLVSFKRGYYFRSFNKRLSQFTTKVTQITADIHSLKCG